jgi:hypothetical protein
MADATFAATAGEPGRSNSVTAVATVEKSAKARRMDMIVPPCLFTPGVWH